MATNWGTGAARPGDGEMEARIGVSPISDLHARLDEMQEEHAYLWALYGQGGLFNDRRKTILSVRALAIRNEFSARNEKVSEARIDEAAHADEEYQAFIDRAVEERIRFAVLDAARDAIFAQMRRDDALVFAFARESSRIGA